MFRYEPKGVCCETIDVEIEGGVVKHVKIYGGCDGNLNAICKLVAGQKIDRVAKLLEGGTCHRHKDTSCADQMVKALRAAQAEQRRGISRREFARFAAMSAASLVVGTPELAIAEPQSRKFTDSLGRAVIVPTTLHAVMPAGDIAQQLVCTLCPELLSSVASEITKEDALELEQAGIGEIADLPKTGGASSSGVEGVVPQAASCTGASLILDAGLKKDSLANDLDALQEEEGVPCVFLDVSFGNLPQAYRMLGDLLDREARAEQLASYVESAMSRAAVAGLASETSPRVFYAPRHNGVEVRSSYTVQTDAITHVGATPITSPYIFPDRTVDIAALNEAKADLIVFDDTKCLASLSRREGLSWDCWSQCTAVTRGAAVVSPALINSWFGSLAYVQSIGVLWLASVIWPQHCNYDLANEAKSFYELFYRMDKPIEDFHALIGLHKEVNYESCK